MVVGMETLEAINQEDVPNVKEPTTEEEKEKVEEEAAKEVGTDKEDGDVCMDVVEGSRSPSKRKRRRTVTPTERPTRERRTVERYTEWASKGSASKQLSIEKGSGTQLKDIPNVAYKLSKRKPDDTLRSLHNILYGKNAKFNDLKKNIGMFSGYVWVDDEHEKQRAKVKERLEKYVKEKLFDFCDVLNLQIHKSYLKKEEVSMKLLEFLESPCATTEVLLADKEQKGKKPKTKRRRKRAPSKKQSTEKIKGQLEDESSHSEENSQEEDNNDASSGADSDEQENVSKAKEEDEPEMEVGKSNKKAKTELDNEELHAAVVKMLKEADFGNVTLSDVLKQLGSHFGMDVMHRKAEVKAVITEAINNMSDEEQETDHGDED